ncbi:hypothetical protein AeRB84_002042 [Aphanomyces euteiches]|nr:hypothetical protein AeRB84_002042 [Aphanomyces euteiches]
MATPRNGVTDSPFHPPPEAPGHVDFLQEDFRQFPFQSQRLLVELQTKAFRDTSSGEFWSFLSSDATAQENARNLPEALHYAAETIRTLEEIAQFPSAQHPRSMLSLLKAHFRAILFHDAQRAEVFSHALEALCSAIFLESLEREDHHIDVATLRSQLHYLEWMHIAKSSIMNVFLRQIDHRIAQMCRDNFSMSFLPEIKAWIDSDLLLDAHSIFHNTNQPVQYVDTLKQHVFRAFGSLRINELFEIVREYPDSISAIEDLAKCLNITHQHGELLSVFERAIRQRVLQPGASTTSIIDVYTRTIKTFRIMDPRGVLQQSISGLFSQYLRKRKDAIRCIVTSLTDDENGELFEELTRDRRVEPVVDSDDDDTDDPPELWQPDPVEATVTKPSRHMDDILSNLVNIYGSQDLFVNEYRMMLADRLLTSKEFSTERDVRTLELLKLRFGEESLQQCEIMIKDVEESKRIYANLRSPVDATIVSQHFWPPFQGTEFTMHPRLDEMVEAYKKAYAVLKNPRQLDWVPFLGSVEIELEINGRSIPFTVNPIQATIISHFEDQDCWIVDDLAIKIEVDSDILLKNSQYWLNRGVLTQVGNTLGTNNSYDPELLVDNVEEHAETSVSSKIQADEEVKVIGSLFMVESTLK